GTRRRFAPLLLTVAAIPFVCFYFFHVIVSRLDFQSPPPLDNLSKRGIDILRHSLRVSADVEIGALFQPFPKFARRLEHSVLDVNFLRLITRERGIEPR